jgi:hypothetical protein
MDLLPFIVADLDVSTKARCDNLIDLFTKRQAMCEVVKAMKFSFQPPDPSSPKPAALRDALPTPIQFILLLTLCSEAKKLDFTNVGQVGEDDQRLLASTLNSPCFCRWLPSVPLK